MAEKIKLGDVPLVYPVPIVLGGALVEGKPDFAAFSDCGLMGIRPPLVFLSSNVGHYTAKGILEHKTYSLNFPHTGMLTVTDYRGIVSGRDVDKSALFEVFYGELQTAPMIQACPVNLECRVIKAFTIEHRQIFVGKVVQAYIDEAFITEQDGRRIIADLTQLDPVIYALDNRYYRIGAPIGIGYQVGKKFTPDE